MATIEGKPETKQESKPDEAKPESNAKEVEENQEPALKYKAWVLKVSIHCEGCKRKVEKILRKIDGVYEVEPDLKQQKVTVKANLHVDVDTLIKKIVKKGRHAELWPEQKEKKPGKSKNKDKQAAQSNTEECNNNNNNHGGGGGGGGGGGDHKDKETLKVELLSVLQDNTASKSCVNIGGGCSCNTPIYAEGFTGTGHVPENKGGGGGGGGGDGGETEGSGGGSKKKKKKKGNATVTFDEGAGPAPTGSVHFTGYGPYGPIPMPSPANHSPPRQHHMPSPTNHSPSRQHHMDEYPTYYRAPPPVYVTSYNTAPSHYASPRPYSCTYMNSDHMSEYSTSLDVYSSRPSDTFEMFSDENPNACSIM